MTLGDAKRKVMMLLDEYSSGGTVTTDADISAKMADFFDMAQKDMAAVEKLTDIYTIVRVEEQSEYPMPSDYRALLAVWRNGQIYRNYRWKGNSIVIPLTDTATVEIEYYKTPADITPQSADSTAFEVSEEAAVACCYYVASKQLINDLVMNYAACENIYQQLRSELARGPRNGQTRVHNALFGRTR